MATDPVSDEQLDAILNQNRVNGSVSMLRPLEIYAARDQLLDLTTRSLQTLRNAPTPDTPKQQTVLQRAIQQRIDFIAWLNGQPEEIYLAIYPVTEDGLTDDDVMDVMHDEDLWPF